MSSSTSASGAATRCCSRSCTWARQSRRSSPAAAGTAAIASRSRLARLRSPRRSPGESAKDEPAAGDDHVALDPCDVHEVVERLDIRLDLGCVLRRQHLAGCLLDSLAYASEINEGDAGVVLAAEAGQRGLEAV